MSLLTPDQVHTFEYHVIKIKTSLFIREAFTLRDLLEGSSVRIFEFSNFLVHFLVCSTPTKEGLRHSYKSAASDQRDSEKYAQEIL